MRHVALEIPLALLALGRRCQSATTRHNPRVEALGDALDHAALAGRVAALEDDHDLQALLLDPFLELDQLLLKGVQLAQVMAVGELVVQDARLAYLSERWLPNSHLCTVGARELRWSACTVSPTRGRTWELVLPALERHHDVLAPALAGHAGGPPVGSPADEESAGRRSRAGDGLRPGSTRPTWSGTRSGVTSRCGSPLAAAPRPWSRSPPPAAGRKSDASTGLLLASVIAMLGRVTCGTIASVRARDRLPPSQGCGRAGTRPKLDHIPAELVAHLIRGARRLPRCVLRWPKHAGVATAGTLDAEQIYLPGADPVGDRGPAAAVAPLGRGAHRDQWLSAGRLG